MKYYLIIFLLSLPLLASAQGRVKINETSAVRYGLNPTTGDSTWYEIRTIEYSDGATDVTETIVQDTTQLINFAAISAVDNLKRSTFHVNGWWRDAAAINHALQVEALLGQFGTSLAAWTIERERAEVDSTAWLVRVNGGQPQAATIAANPAGTRWRLQVGASPVINIFPVGDTRWRMLNYPGAGQNTDLFRVFGGPFLEYRSLSQNVVLRKE